MNKKGFTLVELLAVIVILAVIALIAVPQITKLINNATKEAAISGARNYIQAVETYVAVSESDAKKVHLVKDNKYYTNQDTIIGNTNYIKLNDLVSIKGNKPTGLDDYVILDNKYHVVEAKFIINTYEIKIKDGEVVSAEKAHNIKVQDITLNKTSASIKVDETLQLTATITPTNATDMSVTWSSSDATVVTVSSSGLIAAKKIGTATIKACAVNNKCATSEITVEGDYLSDFASVGDYVAYDAGSWTSTASRPTSQGNFGGYTSGQNKANSVSWCYNSEKTTNLKGWRVLSINKSTHTVIIVHAGIPECYYHASGNYADASVTKLNDRATSQYYNRDYADSAHNMNYDEAYAITGSTDTTINDLRYIGPKGTTSNSAYYWLARANSSSSVSFVGHTGTFHSGINYSLGVRPVVVLKPKIQTAGKTTDKVGQSAWSLVKP